MKTFKEILKARGLTPTKVAAMTDIPLVTVSSHFYGVRKMSADSALRYERQLGIPRAELCPQYWGEGENAKN